MKRILQQIGDHLEYLKAAKNEPWVLGQAHNQASMSHEEDPWYTSVVRGEYQCCCGLLQVPERRLGHPDF